MITSFVDEKDVGPIGGQTGIHDDASMSSWNVSECETILILIINCNRQWVCNIRVHICALLGLSLITCLYHAPLVFVLAHVDQSFGLCIMFLPLSDFFLFSSLSLSLSFPSLLSLSPSSFCDLLCYTLTHSLDMFSFYSLSRLVFILVLLKITWVIRCPMLSHRGSGMRILIR